MSDDGRASGFVAVQAGQALATVVTPPDGSLDHEAARIVQALRARYRVDIPVIPGAGAAQKLSTPHAIALGCLADNPFIETLYQRWHCLVDRWYPGADGWVVHTIMSPLRPGEHVLLLGGSDARGVGLAVTRGITDLTARDDGRLPWRLEVELGADHLPLPADRIDVLGTSASPVTTPEAALPTQPYVSGFGGGTPRQHLLRLGMYGPHADNYHLSRSSQFGLRYLYTGRSQDAARYRDALLSETRSGTVARLYHYKSLRMFQLWSLLAPCPVFTDAERRQITGTLRTYLLEESGITSIEALRSGSVTTGIFSRHHACDALNLWVGADWLWRQTGQSRWLEDRSVADAYFAAQAGTDVPLTGLTEGYASYLEVVLEWMLLSQPEEITTDRHIQLWAHRVLGLCTNRGQLVLGPQTDSSRYPYHLLRKLAFLLDDGRFLFVADLRERQVHAGMDRVLQFSAGQAYAGDVEACEPVDDEGLTVFPLNERLRAWQAPSIRADRGFDRAVARSGWDEDADYLLVIGVRSGGKSLPNVGALAAYERFGRRLITSEAVPLFPRSASPWRHSSVTISVGGLGFGMAEGAEILTQGQISGGHLLSFVVPQKGARWIRQIYWQPSAYVLIVDHVIVDEPEQSLHVGVNWRCAPRLLGIDANLATLDLGPETDGRFFVEVSEALHLESRSSTYPVLGAPPGTAPSVETMLHATLDKDHNSEAIEIATLLHAVSPMTEPRYRLVSGVDGWTIEGGTEARRFRTESGHGEVTIDVNPTSPSQPPPQRRTGGRPRSGQGSCGLPTRWACDLPTTVSAWTQAANGRLAIGTADGGVTVIDSAGSTQSTPSCAAAVTALTFLDGDVIAGTQSGQVCRFDKDGAEGWRHQCGFRPERTFYPYWFLETPCVGALAVGHDPLSARDLLVVGTGSTSLNILDASDGALIEDVLSPYGLPDRIRPHLSAQGGLQFLVGHAWLTCGSTVRTWRLAEAAQEGPRYSRNVDAMGRSGGDWDSCGVVDVWVGPLTPDMAEVVIVLRHGAVNQLTVYDAASGTPLWDATLGGSPIALAVVPGASADSARCFVADEFGWLVTLDGGGRRVAATRLERCLRGMHAGAAGELVLWSERAVHVGRADSPMVRHDLAGAPLGWWAHEQAAGLLCVEEGRLALRDLSPLKD